MYGKNLFEGETVREITERIDKLSAGSPRLWGKMDVAQMMTHCALVLETALGKNHPPQNWVSRTIGPLFKGMYLNEKPFSKSTPTNPLYVMVDPKDFVVEQDHLKRVLQEFHESQNANTVPGPHPFFGKLTPDQWARGMYKHLDHHLRQFGV